MKFLWEIGCEELPPNFIPMAIGQLKDGAERILKENDIDFSKVEVFGTPRRLVLLIEDVAQKQREKLLEIKGPPYHIAFDEKGNPTQAAIGFAKSQGVSVDELIVKEDRGGRYVFAVKIDKGRSTEELLKETLPALLYSIYLPKSMRWDSSNLRFIRPIRWHLALLDDKLVELKIGELISQRTTYLVRYLQMPFSPSDVDEYLGKMEEEGIILDPEKRREKIIGEAKRLAESVGGRISPSEDFVDKVVFLNEKPKVFLGKIDERFLSLPREVIATAMEKQLNLFSISNNEGNLLPYFVGVRDGDDFGLENVIEGYGQVLKARLADAHFFFYEDLKIPLRERIPRLSGIIFLRGLGTIADKVRRMKRAIELLPLEDDIKEKAIRTAELCRADLTTHLVGEFPSLQGTVGMYYALLQGEDKEVAEAIYQSYQYTLGENGIRTPLGKLVSLVDKMDTLAGAFHLGLQPSGSSDPFALRRACQTVIDILREEDRFNLEGLLETIKIAYREEMGIELERLEELWEFIVNRFGLALRESGIRYDIVNAVLAGDMGNLKEVFARAKALDELREEEDFVPTVMASVRLINIIRFAQKKGEEIGDEVKEELFQLEEEKKLFKAGKEVETKLEALRRKGDYKAIFKRLSSLRELINRFFDKVLVMTEDDELRANRLGLVNFIWKLFFNQFGDLSQIVIEG